MEKEDYIDCEVFADLLQKIYENPNENFEMDRDQINTIPAFSLIELVKGLKRMKKRCSADTSGIVVELIQYAGTMWVMIPGETSENTMRRMTTRVNSAVNQSKMKEWSTRLAESLWNFVACLKMLPVTSWPSRAAFWQPQNIDDPSCEFLPHRRCGRPCTRWDDRVSNFSWKHFGKKWEDVPNLNFVRALPNFVSSYMRVSE